MQIGSYKTVLCVRELAPSGLALTVFMVGLAVLVRGLYAGVRTNERSDCAR